MTTSPAQLFQRLEQEIQAARAETEKARDHERMLSKRLEAIATERTDAFVELAKHLLPELTHESLANTWKEVQSEIRDVLLRKDYDRRQLSDDLRSLIESETKQIKEFDKAQKDLDAAKQVLACKTGNVQKALRDDPEVTACTAQIQKLDAEIEICLAKLDFADAEANSKLADYEDSHLFQYLLDRGYGTHEYTQKGYQRRWDRWVARLVNFDKSKKSFDVLSQTPVKLRELIDEKQQRYRELLDRMRNAKRAAAQRHGVREQKELWQNLYRQVQALEASLQLNRQQQKQRRSDLADFDRLEGKYYDESIKIFRRFLQGLEPDVLRIYTECTPSKEDDLICARIRKMQTDIDAHRQSSKRRFISVVRNEKYVAALSELSDRLKRHLFQSLGEIYFDLSFDFDEVLDDMRNKELPPTQAWRRIRDSMMDKWDWISRGPFPENVDGPAQELKPLDAWFTAASEFARRVPQGDNIDLSGVMLYAIPVNAIPSPEKSFSTLAICPSRREAKFLERSLRDASIPCFAHTRKGREGNDDSEAEVDLVVATTFLTEAADLIARLRWEYEQAWLCHRCKTRVDEGFSRCWRCGQPRVVNYAANR